MARAPYLTTDDLALAPAPALGSNDLSAMTLEEAERHLVRHALDRHEGNVNSAAAALGMSRSALYRRLQQWGLAGRD